MNAIDCPHCQATDRDAGAFCVACGKAMPRPSDKPRVYGRDELARTTLGRELQLDALRPQIRGGRLILIIFAALPIGLGLLIMLGSLLIEDAASQKETLAGAGVFIVMGLLTLGLWFWAGRRPFPATLMGLILYTTSAIALFPELFGESAGGILFVILICVAAAVLLAGPAGHGLRYRTLLRLAEDQTGPGR